MRPELPTGTVTFLFTDVEGSTKLLHELGPDAYAAALAEHRRIVRAAVAAHGGVEVDTQGDAFFVAFQTAPGGLAAAAAARDALAGGPIRVRIGIHTGTPHLTAEGYVGADVHRAARIAAAGHGGQVLVSAATVALLGTAGLRDLGEHRLKDFSEPVAIHQLGDGRFPPLRTISNTNLPRPASSFVGRDTEVAEVTDLLQNGARLLTLTGPGGSGKTRLAIEAAATLVPEFKAGVFWVGLAPLRDPALVTETIGQTLGATDGLAEHIGEREMLLLIDNLEQVVAAAPEVASLVETCPNLRLLVTSRELLRVRGEVEYPVLPLADPDAVDLFCARARTEPDDTIRQLCHALDNLPLALELAAARASALTPAQILKRLSHRLDLLKGGRDADPRQQTLRATIEWSFELLSPDEQRLFARLAVFAGGWTLDAAEVVAKADLDTLQSLVNKSLVRHTDERFWMLETIREYAVERLEESGEADGLRRRHAELFLALAEEAEPHVRGQSPEEWLERLEREHDNLRAALDWLEATASGELGLRLAGAVDEFWCARNHVPEGRRSLESALRLNKRPTPARAKALIGAAHLARDSGDPAAGRLWAEEGLALHRRLGDPWGTANSLLWLGLAVADEGDFPRAQQLFGESADAFGALDDAYYTLYANRMLAWTYDALGDRPRARALHEENLRRARDLHARDLEASVLGALASYAEDEGRVQDAALLAAESLRIFRDLGNQVSAVVELCRCAAALSLAGESGIATQLLGSSAAFHEEAGTPLLPYLVAENERTLTRIHSQLDEADFAEAWERGRKLTVEEATKLALESLSGIAEVSR
ncbi:MAG: adenylate/guanylate cyclase domain-containing protein [Chloroflexota bacterium]